MKRILLAATFLTAATALSLPAHAIDVNIGAGAEGALDIVVGGNGGANVGAGVGAGANVGANANAVANAGVNAATNAAAAAGARINAAAAAVTEVALRTDAATNATANVAASAVINAAVWTNDNVNLGTVVALMTTMDGRIVAVVDTTDGWLQNVDRIMVNVAALVQTNAGLVLQTNDADLKSSITGGLTGNAMAGVTGGTAGIDAAAAAVTEIQLRTNATTNAMATVAATALVNATVWTNDNVNVGTVQSFMTTLDGQVVAIIDTTDGWLANADRIAVQVSTLVQTDAGLQVQTNDADLKATATAALAAQLAAAATR